MTHYHPFINYNLLLSTCNRDGEVINSSILLMIASSPTEPDVISSPILMIGQPIMAPFVLPSSFLEH